MQCTTLHDKHVSLSGKMVDFAGWAMPLHYGSQMDEHHIVRQHAGIFDVSHMRVIDVTGSETLAYLQYLLANDIAKAADGQALYSCLLNESGMIVDDLIAYRVTPTHVRIVVNAATGEKDYAHFAQYATDFDVTLTQRPDLGILAVQGPQARALAATCFSEAQQADIAPLKPFRFALGADDTLIARTGYTGEDGFEIILPTDQIEALFDAFLAVGIKPCGLGARDTLRLEAGMNLYGTDMDETTHPFESGLGWTVAMRDERDFVGRAALTAIKADGVTHVFKALLLEQGGVLRHGQKVLNEQGAPCGEITSGSFSPTLKQSVAFARIEKAAGTPHAVQVRNKALPIAMVKAPFVRHGKAVYETPALCDS